MQLHKPASGLSFISQIKKQTNKPTAFRGITDNARTSTIGYTIFFSIKKHWKTLEEIKFVVVALDLIICAFTSHKRITEKEYRCRDEDFSSAISVVPGLSSKSPSCGFLGAFVLQFSSRTLIYFCTKAQLQ